MTERDKATLRDRIARTRLNTVQADTEECGACGGNKDQLNQACSSCRSRHTKRRHAGLVPAIQKLCKSCSVRFDDRTAGCVVCDRRFASRLWRQTHPVTA